MTTSNLNIRIDDDLKNQAKAILDGYGISPSQAVKMLFLELVATRKFPLSLSYQADYEPNEITLQAINELESGIYTESTLDELLELKNA
ncbi:MAG: type II toxin-antitoxin system RelB/DinJ family antitoxin [Moraxella sp.]|nr:type II toxin-antitoxin system RelB/DinJ family antitoxin [Moraxella sp.]